MNRCIYLKKCEPEVTFQEVEHIIPAGIGGIKTLDHGVVSDQANLKFSALELDFMRNSIISLPRQFYGPGKRGSLSPGKASKSNIHIMYTEGNASLGYIKMGKPHQIPQIVIEPNNEIKMVFDAENGDYQKQLADFIDNLKGFNGKYVPVRRKELRIEQTIIGYFDKKWFVASRNDIDDEKMDKIIKIANSSFEIKSPPQVCSSQVQSSEVMAFNIESFNRVYAKIAFNYLASIEGADFVLRDIFDPIRDWIVNGGENTFANLIGSQDNGFLQQIPFPPDSHKILIMKVGTSLVGFVGLYGHIWETVNLCNTFDENYNLNGLVCDWRNNQEYSLIDFVANINHL